MTDTKTIDLLSNEAAIALAGYKEDNIKYIAAQTGAKLVLRGQELIVGGRETQIDRVEKVIRLLQPLWKTGKVIAIVDVRGAIEALDTGQIDRFQDMQSQSLAVDRRGNRIRPKTIGQQKYVQAIHKHDLTFCIGPAGTGKTYLAAVVAVQALLNGECERLILTRPAVEAGEKLGFLPGDLQQKIDPFLRPLYDALYEFIDADKIPALMEKGTIEVAPLAYMRGRTLSNAFIIVDEAQNTTPAQMKMVLTRIGFRSKAIVTGDITQTDLPINQTSGLVLAEKILGKIEGISFCHLTRADVVRHPLVEKIVAAYENYG
jgi:phosphate starvation-inducible protein PhoH and related proteins